MDLAGASQFVNITRISTCEPSDYNLFSLPHLKLHQLVFKESTGYYHALQTSKRLLQDYGKLTENTHCYICLSFDKIMTWQNASRIQG